MINIKPYIYNAIKDIAENVNDGYPESFATFPVIGYVEEENKTYIKTDDRERISYVRYRIDVWNDRSTSNIACSIDNAISKLGFKRIFCQDISEVGGLKHKVLRYEGYINVDNLEIYN